MSDDHTLCEHKTLLTEDDFGSGKEIQCSRDAEGAFEMVMDGDVAAIMALCPECRKDFEERDMFDELRPTDDYTPEAEREIE